MNRIEQHWATECALTEARLDAEIAQLRSDIQSRLDLINSKRRSQQQIEQDIKRACNRLVRQIWKSIK